MVTGRPHYAIVAGLFASAASLFGKFISYKNNNVQSIDGDADAGASSSQFLNNWILTITCFILMVLCNVMVWSFFVKSLHQRGGSVIATVTSTATNYCFSAMIGSFVFDERTGALWWFGTALVILGLVFISTDADRPAKQLKINTKIE